MEFRGFWGLGVGVLGVSVWGLGFGVLGAEDWRNGKEKGNYYHIRGYVLGLYGDNGKQNGNYPVGFGVGVQGFGLGFKVLLSILWGLRTC